MSVVTPLPMSFYNIVQFRSVHQTQNALHTMIFSLRMNGVWNSQLDSIDLDCHPAVVDGRLLRNTKAYKDVSCSHNLYIQEINVFVIY